MRDGSRIMWRILLTGLLICPFLAGAQVVHNFEMGPENTDCAHIDSLDLPEQEFAGAIQQLTFRFREEITISRYSAPRKLEYVSCDGETGYLLAWQDDVAIFVYTELPSSGWEAIKDAPDPRLAYVEIQEKYKRYKQKKAP